MVKVTITGSDVAGYIAIKTDIKENFCSLGYGEKQTGCQNW
jgi:hypothetical protein